MGTVTSSNDLYVTDAGSSFFGKLLDDGSIEWVGAEVATPVPRSGARGVHATGGGLVPWCLVGCDELFQKRLRGFFEGFVREGAFDVGGDFAIGVDEERRWEDLASSVGLEDFGVSEGDWVIDLVAGDEHAEAARIFLNRDADDLKALIGELGLELHEGGDFLAAGRTPGAPKIEDDRFAREVFAGDFRARDRGEFPSWSFGFCGR